MTINEFHVHIRIQVDLFYRFQYTICIVKVVHFNKGVLGFWGFGVLGAAIAAFLASPAGNFSQRSTFFEAEVASHSPASCLNFPVPP